MPSPSRGAAALREQTRANLARATVGVKQQQQETEQIRIATRAGWPHLPLEMLHPDPLNPRKTEDPVADDELKAAIIGSGRLEIPLTIYQREGLGWVIKHGHRRHRVLSRLVEEGHDEFRTVPVFIDTPPEQSPEGERSLRIAQVIENNARRGLSALDSAEQFHMIATLGAGSTLSARQVGSLAGVEERTMQRYFFIAQNLSRSERDLLREGFPDAGFSSLYALAEWLRDHGERLTPGQRQQAVLAFVREKPRPKMVPLVLRSLAPRQRAGRPARKRFQAGRTANGAFQVKLTLPAALTGDAAAIQSARKDLEKALIKLDELEERIKTGEQGGE